MPKWKGDPSPIAPGLRAALARFFMAVSNVAGGLVFAEIPSQPPKTPPTSMPTLLYIQVFSRYFGIERAIFHRNRGTGEGSCRF